MAEIQSVNHTHDQIMNWLIANPELSNRQCAEYFGYSESWLSTLVHSDVFQAKFRERQDVVFGFVASEVKEKLTGLGNMVAEQLMEKLEKNEDKQFTLDAFDKVMKASGYAPNSTKNTPAQLNQQNNFFITKDTLAEARASMLFKRTVEVQDTPLIESFEE